MVLLDIGAGENPRGDINVDIRRLKGIDIICQALRLPFKDASFDKVYLGDVIEHFRYKDVVILLREINQILKHRGIIEIWTPNFQALSFLYVWLFGKQSLQTNPPILWGTLNGLQDYEENVHLSHWTFKLLREYVMSAGFEIILAKSEGSWIGEIGNPLLNFIIRIGTMLFSNRKHSIHFIALKP
jgi:predicted SAM-dependent methyltransferase